MMKYFFVLLIILNSLICFASKDETILKAHESYSKGDYQIAIEKYSELYGNHIKNGEIHYNLGNMYFRGNQLGEAIFHYKMAQKLRPRDGDILYNLKYAQDKAIDKIEIKSNLFFKALTMTNVFNEKESYYLILFAWGIFWTLLFIYMIKKNELIKWAKISFLVVSLLLTIITVKDSLNYKRFGVVVDPKANIYSAIGKDNVVLFTLHQGAEFKIKEQTDTWARIILNDKKQGWIQKNKTIIEK